MIEDLCEGKTYTVLSKKEGNKFSINFRSWNDVEKYLEAEEGVYKILSIELYEIPLTGLKRK